MLFDEFTGKDEICKVPTEIPEREGPELQRFPCYEAIFGPNANVQECRVNLEDGTQFIIVAEWNPDADQNTAIKASLPEHDWKGSILVMKPGFAAFIVNLRRSAERGKAVQAVKK